MSGKKENFNKALSIWEFRLVIWTMKLLQRISWNNHSKCKIFWSSIRKMQACVHRLLVDILFDNSLCMRIDKSRRWTNQEGFLSTKKNWICQLWHWWSFRRKLIRTKISDLREDLLSERMQEICSQVWKKSFDRDREEIWTRKGSSSLRRSYRPRPLRPVQHKP